MEKCNPKQWNGVSEVTLETPIEMEINDRSPEVLIISEVCWWKGCNSAREVEEVLPRCPPVVST